MNQLTQEDGLPLNAAWAFGNATFAGYVSGGGEHGIEITRGAHGEGAVTRPMCLNVEHYHAQADGSGTMVPRKKADTVSTLDDGRVTVSIAPYEGWPVHTNVTFRVVEPATVDAEYSFRFEEDITGFEAFISNYFHDPDPPYLRVGGQWVQGQLADGEHRYWARDAVAAALADDGRMDVFLEASQHRYTTPISEAFYDDPIMVTPIRDTGWSVVHLIERAHCMSLSANRMWHAHDFSLVGRDVTAGETVRCRARMVYTKLALLDEAQALYAAFDPPAAL